LQELYFYNLSGDELQELYFLTYLAICGRNYIIFNFLWLFVAGTIFFSLSDYFLQELFFSLSGYLLQE
jgi:hypothetical protein